MFCFLCECKFTYTDKDARLKKLTLGYSFHILILLLFKPKTLMRLWQATFTIATPSLHSQVFTRTVCTVLELGHRRHGSLNMTCGASLVYVSLCVYVCACVGMCARLCGCMFVRVCVMRVCIYVRVCVCV